MSPGRPELFSLPARTTGWSLHLRRDPTTRGRRPPRRLDSGACVLEVGSASAPISMETIDGQIQGGDSPTALTTGTDSFTAAVPAHQHDVALVLSEGSFSQSFNLWTLKRVPPAPSVLYRDASSSSVTGSVSGPLHLTFTNPADGFTSSDDPDVVSSALTWFPPDGSAASPTTTSQAFLVVNLQSAYPNVPYGQPGSGDYFASFEPLPAAMLTFTPSGGSAITAMTAPRTSSTGNGNDDDGLFDALYWFSVPATTTTGTLSVAAGTVTGTQYSGFEGIDQNEPLSITAPCTTVTFPAEDVVATQHTPAWVHGPLPKTGTGAALAAGSTSGPAGAMASRSGRPPFCWCSWRRPSLWASACSLDDASSQIPLRSLCRRRLPTHPLTTRWPHLGQRNRSSRCRIRPHPLRPRHRPPPCSGSSARSPTTPTARCPTDGSPKSCCAGWCSTVRIPTTPMRSNWPSGRPRAPGLKSPARRSTPTFRDCASASGPTICPTPPGRPAIASPASTATGSSLSVSPTRPTSHGQRSIELRTRALALVRGVPFKGVGNGQYEWVFSEDLHSYLTNAVITCALRLTNELMALGRFKEAEEAAEAGLRGVPRTPICSERETGRCRPQRGTDPSGSPHRRRDRRRGPGGPRGPG